MGRDVAVGTQWEFDCGFPCPCCFHFRGTARNSPSPRRGLPFKSHEDRSFLDTLKFESHYYIVNFVSASTVNWLTFPGFPGLNFWKKESDWLSASFCTIGHGEAYGLAAFWVSGGRAGDVRNLHEADPHPRLWWEADIPRRWLRKGGHHSEAWPSGVGISFLSALEIMGGLFEI